MGKSVYVTHVCARVYIGVQCIPYPSNQKEVKIYDSRRVHTAGTCRACSIVSGCQLNQRLIFLTTGKHGFSGFFLTCIR